MRFMASYLITLSKHCRNICSIRFSGRENLTRCNRISAANLSFWLFTWTKISILGDKTTNCLHMIFQEACKQRSFSFKSVIFGNKVRPNFNVARLQSKFHVLFLWYKRNVIECRNHYIFNCVYILTITFNDCPYL